jgi:hypothetical protein
MILVTLLLAVELIQRKEQAPPQKTAELTPQIEQTVAANRSEIDRIREQLARQGANAVELAEVDPSHLRELIEDNAQATETLQGELDKLRQEEDDADKRRDAARDHLAQRSGNAQTTEEMLAEIQEKQEELRKLQQSNRMIFNPDSGTSKSPWIIEIVGGKISAAPVGRSARPVVFDDLAAFESWAGGRDAGGEYFVLMVKPDGIDTFAGVREYLVNKRFDIGYDLVTADQDVLDPEVGAGTP